MKSLTRRGSPQAPLGSRGWGPSQLGAALLTMAAALGSAGCEAEVADARTQWLVYVATDAPVPQFGDRLLVELIDAEGQIACSGCRRQFGIGRADRWPMSFGLLPPESAGALRVRARLYRAQDTGADGLPGSDRIIDALATLPAADGLTRVGIALSMECFGVIADVEAGQSCDPATGELAAEPTLAAIEDEQGLPQPGSWPPAATVPCGVEVPADMVCVPGGVFLLGSPTTTLDGALRPRPERPTVLSPFALDVEEVTVGQVRELVRDQALSAPVEYDPDPSSVAHACQYLGVDDSSNDAMAVNCVPHTLAVEICERLGKRLPSEAEWEFAAGNRTDESTYPWGGSEDVCRYAIVARAQQALTGNEVLTCRVIDGQTVGWGPVAGGHERDLNTLGIRNLGGNLAEWLTDRINSYDSDCWQPEDRILFDPVCSTGDTTTHAIRGGSWPGFPLEAKVFVRDGSFNDGADKAIGVRCAQSM